MSDEPTYLGSSEEAWSGDRFDLVLVRLRFADSGPVFDVLVAPPFGRAITARAAAEIVECVRASLALAVARREKKWPSPPPESSPSP